jgi:hypothetical protein
MRSHTRSGKVYSRLAFELELQFKKIVYMFVNFCTSSCFSMNVSLLEEVAIYFISVQDTIFNLQRRMW